MSSILGTTGISVLFGALVLGAAAPSEAAHAAQFHVLYVFQGGSDGASPFGAMIKDTKGRYGTTYYGGTNNVGTVFKLARDGTEAVLHSIMGATQNIFPWDTNEGGADSARILNILVIPVCGPWARLDGRTLIGTSVARNRPNSESMHVACVRNSNSYFTALQINSEKSIAG